ncbi:hypothetical protein PR202_ga16973 [Eleusine coracana subsp. coracana]|uniref:TRF2/HOY1 PH-like domain-containing protein n=1 Tax=Eleusine coracana subsp. coracana TaxID=191504 RepID=A0AAV5CP22_ELECO|nr:hypothetical protein PR202_ga16973 [Eleusine coracana subsp. coracana]
MEMTEHDDNGSYMQLMENNQNVQGMQWKEDELLTQHLKLDIGDSFLSFIRLMLAWYRNGSTQIKYSDRSKYEELKTVQSQLICAKNSKEVMPTELPLLALFVGNKKLFRAAECDIFARFFYQRKKVACQMRNGTLSRRVEIPFSDITALHACFDHTGFDTLRIERLQRSQDPSSGASASLGGRSHHPSKDSEWGKTKTLVGANRATRGTHACCGVRSKEGYQERSND